MADYGEPNLRWRGQGKPHKDECHARGFALKIPASAREDRSDGQIATLSTGCDANLAYNLEFSSGGP